MARKYGIGSCVFVEVDVLEQEGVFKNVGEIATGKVIRWCIVNIGWPTRSSKNLIQSYHPDRGPSRNDRCGFFFFFSMTAIITTASAIQPLV